MRATCWDDHGLLRTADQGQRQPSPLRVSEDSEKESELTERLIMKKNVFSHYHISYGPSSAPIRAHVRLDDGKSGESVQVAGYLNFWNLPEEDLPSDELAPTGYILKNESMSLLMPVLDLLHREIDIANRSMVIGAIENNQHVRTWLSTARDTTAGELQRFFGPTINYLAPDTVKQGWTGTVRIHGNRFDSGSFALFDGAVPRILSRNTEMIGVEVDADITKTPGAKLVKVHTGGGELSNEVQFSVKPA